MLILRFGQYDFRQANSILRKISSILCDNSKHNIHLVEYSVWEWRSRNLTDFPRDQLWLGHRDSSPATWQWPETFQCWCTAGGSCWFSFRMRLGWSFCHRDVSSGSPTNRGSRNLTKGLQVLQFDNGLELSNPLSLYPAEGWLLRIRFWINIFSFYYKLINFPLPHWDNNSDTLKMNFRLVSANLHLCIV